MFGKIILWFKCGFFAEDIRYIDEIGFCDQKDRITCRGWPAEGAWNAYWNFWTSCWPLWVWPWWLMGSICWSYTTEYLVMPSPLLLLIRTMIWYSLVDPSSWLFLCQLIISLIICQKLGMTTVLLTKHFPVIIQSTCYLLWFFHSACCYLEDKFIILSTVICSHLLLLKFKLTCGILVVIFCPFYKSRF